ncbi:putative ATP-grasp-modified RiPP [Streptosporangium sp. NPDC003464]
MTITAEHPPLAQIPWGLSRTTAPLPEGEALYDTVDLDPVTQLTAFRNQAGLIVDMAKTTVTTSKGGGSDGSSGSSNVADDSNTDG